MFTYDPTTSRGRVRLLIGDTDTADSTKQVFTDAEVDAFLALEGSSVRRAAAAACEALATASASSAVMYRAEKLFEIDKKNIPTHFLALARQHRETESDVTAETIDNMDYRVTNLGQQAGEFVGDEEFLY